MATPCTANVYIQNLTGGTAVITMSHEYSWSDPQTATWTVAPGETAGPLIVNFETGIGTGLDYWYCSAAVMDGPNPGIYVTEGSASNPKKECELKPGDASKTFTNTVDTHTFRINMPSGSCTTPMTRTGPYSPITNVFLLMLENHSFDHIFGFSKLPVNGLDGTETNSYTNSKGTTITVKATTPAVDPMTTDPSHEFLDTMEQLCGTSYGPTQKNPFEGNPNAVYPPVDHSGFVANYATTTDENTGLPAPADVGDVMTGCSPDQVPVMMTLAQEFAVCDYWCASIPGPTWPNRLFSLAASSSGLDDSPSSKKILKWETVSGIEFQNGNIFGRLSDHGLQYNLFNDAYNSFAPDPASPLEGGGFPLGAALAGIHHIYYSDFGDFNDDVQGAYPYHFTLIEPNYGDASGDTYKGGSSQHPEDGLWAGEALIAATYNSIRNSPIWNTSLLIITYDEHGGYYDHGKRPEWPDNNATPPGDTPPTNLSMCDFNFTKLGVRVPAVIVSPLIAKGVVDSTMYDHTSILSTVEDLFCVPPLTNRDKVAPTLTHLLNVGTPARTDCPLTISPGPKPDVVPSAKMTKSEMFDDPTLLPEQGNVIGHLLIAAKTDIELSDGTKAAKEVILERVQAIKTRGDARRYFAEVHAKLEGARAFLGG